MPRMQADAQAANRTIRIGGSLFSRRRDAAEDARAATLCYRKSPARGVMPKLARQNTAGFSKSGFGLFVRLIPKKEINNGRSRAQAKGQRLQYPMQHSRVRQNQNENKSDDDFHVKTPKELRDTPIKKGRHCATHAYLPR